MTDDQIAEIKNASDELDKLETLISALSDELKALGKANETSDDGKEERTEKSDAIDFHTKNLEIKRLMSEIIRSISKICLSNQGAIGKEINTLKDQIKPFIDAQTTVNGLSSFIKKVKPVVNALVSAATAVAVVYATKG